MSIAVFLPVRKGSERVINKNNRPFANKEGGLLEVKLKQLSKLKVSEIILSTNDEESLEYARKLSLPNLKIDIRPDSLAMSNTRLEDLISYVPTITDCEDILWTHVTSPLVTNKIYEKAIDAYFENLENGYDSLMSVTPFQNFLWNKETREVENNVTKELRWPRTQDLKKLYEINSAIFCTNRKIFTGKKDRIGDSPFLFEISKIDALDVDWEDDFLIAEAVYEKLYV